MAWAFNIATTEYSCPKCGANKGVNCKTPSNHKCNKPHRERVEQLNETDLNKCRGSVLSFQDITSNN